MLKRKFSKPEMTKSTLIDAKKMTDNAMFLEEWKTYFIIYRNDERKFDEAWVKQYVLILDIYCTREVQEDIKRCLHSKQQ